MSEMDGGQAAKQAPKKPLQQQTQGFQLLPMITKHYKTALLLIAIWLTGYLGFSTTWVLIGYFFYVVNAGYRKVKVAKRAFSQDATINEKRAILTRVDEIPAWVYFPDTERAEWLNKMIKQMWPYIGDYVKKLLKDTVEPAVDSSMPSSLKPFKFDHIDLGDTPPRIGGVKVYVENVRRDEIIMDLELFYAGDAEVKVIVRGMTAGIKNLTIHGVLRVIFKPLVPVIPLIGGLNVFFLNSPSIDFDLTNIANLLDTPLVSNTLRTVVEDVVASYLVLPNKIPIQLVNEIDVNRLKFPMPQGVLRLHVVAARELKKADTALFGKSSDPYCKLYVGAQTFQTPTIKNNINPVWNKYFEAVVDQKFGQVVEIEVLDEDPGKDDELGSASMNIESVANQGFVDSWLPLENVPTGMVHIRALWFHLSKDPEDLSRAAATQMEGYRSQSEEHLSTALLLVTVDSAKGLPRGKKLMSEPSPYVNVGVGNTKKKSLVKHKTTDPRWEESFQFMVHNVKVQELYLEVLDGNKSDKKLGHINFAIKDLLTAKDLTVHRPFQLENSTPDAKITLRLSLRILTSEMPQEWAMDSASFDIPTTEPEHGKQQDTATVTGDSTEDRAKQQPQQTEEVVAAESAPTVTSDPNENEKHFTVGGDSDTASMTSSTAPDRTGTELRHRGTSLSSSLSPFGRVQLTVRYSASRNKLVCVVHQCTNLIACDDDNLSDPYVKIYLLPEKSSNTKRKTQVSKNNLNPIFDETFEWNISQSEAVTKMLEVSVKNSTSFLSRKQKEMGQVIIDLSKFDDITKTTTDWYDLMDPESDKSSLTSM